ncbi:MAG TPA: DUF3300 domain-containing protein [Candidatus Bathyarchaeia archaeon]|nr:DUF3300 domain-containing protein [Candidatus Bathyarchaeia archaeon]
MILLKRLLVVLTSLLLVWITIQREGEAWPAPAAARQEVYQQVSPNDLDALVAPIALYPDALVAQILGAATYPDQVEAADTFINSHYELSGDALIQAAEGQGWDPSVMALLRFPSVLDKLSKNLGWTSALGDVSANQQADVMAAIQRMRAKAYAAGNLKSGEQIKVMKESPDVIVIQSTNPQIVYVPTYNSTVVYGSPVMTPGYSAGDVVAASVLSFGVGVAVGAMINNSGCGWGYYGWRVNWAGGVVYCGGGPYYGNPYWWGGYYPGFRPGYHPPYYPPPRPPMPPPPGWRPPYPPGSRPPYPPGGRPPGNVKPTPLPERPGRPSTLPAQPGPPSIQPVQPGGSTRPTTRPATQTNTRDLRGYPSNTPSAQPTAKPNVFSGTTGGRPESARGNRSLNPSPTRTPKCPGKGTKCGQIPMT